MGPIVYPVSVTNYHSSLCNNPAERSSDLDECCSRKKKILTGEVEGDKEYISKEGEGKMKESKIFDKQIQNKKSTREEVIAWRYSMVKLPHAGPVDKKNTGMWNEGQGKTKRQRRLKD